MSNKLFTYNTLIDTTGIQGGGNDGFFEVSGLDKIRVVIEDAGVTNEIQFNVKINGQNSSTILGSAIGEGNFLFDIKTYDLLQINCTTLDGSAVRFSSTGFKVSGDSAVQEYSTFANLPAPTGSGSIAWVTDEASFYYDEPSSSQWKTGTGSSVSLPNTQVGFGSAANQVTGDADFTYNSTTNTLTVPNLEVGGTAILNTLYKPEDVYTLAGADITNKFVTLSSTPTDPTKTRLAVEGGGAQIYGIDFTVVGNQLTWLGLSLDGILEVGDQLLITFN